MTRLRIVDILAEKLRKLTLTLFVSETVAQRPIVIHRPTRLGVGVAQADDCHPCSQICPTFRIVLVESLIVLVHPIDELALLAIRDRESEYILQHLDSGTVDGVRPGPSHSPLPRRGARLGGHPDRA